MKKIAILPFIKKTLLILLVFIGFTAIAQDESGVYINPSDPAFIAKYKDVDFSGKFAVSPVSDNTNNYYIVDFSMLPSKFEKVYFMNLVFKSGKVVNIDGDLGKDRVWFLSNRKNKTTEVFTLFDELKEKTGKVNSTMSDQEKSAWMKSNDKY